MSIERLFAERSALPERGVAVVTRWTRIPLDETDEWRVPRRYMREGVGYDIFDVHKGTTIFEGEVTDSGTFRFARTKGGSLKPLATAHYRVTDDCAALSRGHRAVVDAIERGRLPLGDIGGLRRCLEAELLAEPGEGPRPPTPQDPTRATS